MSFHERGFFKVLVHNFHHEMKIPERFVREYWKGLSNPVLLMLPNNAEQRVHWIQRNEDEIWLKQGWSQVVEDFALEHAQFLTFDYKGSSCFKVKIYHKTDSVTLPPHNERCFFQILVHSKFHQKLMVPRCFSNEYWKGMSNPIKLELPDGVEKKVSWSRRGESVWLEQGWEKVVELCGLCFEWLLTFEYKGRSCFEVKVYDNTALRVAYYNIHENNNNKNKKDCEETVTHDDDDEDDDDDDYGEVDESDEISSSDDDESHEFVHQQYFRRNKTNSVNGLQRNPRFKFRMQESYVDARCVAIPARFARRHLEEGPIRMKVGNRSWIVNYKTWKGCSDKYRKHKLQSGWLKFRRDNHLEVGDLCVFELTSKVPQTMTVRLKSG